MAYTKVIGVFDEPAAVDRAKGALIRAQLADESTMWTEPETMSQDLHPPGDPKAGDPGEHGRTLLVVTVRQELAGAVREVLRAETSGADPVDVAAAVARDPRLPRQIEQRELLRSAAGAPRELDS